MGDDLATIGQSGRRFEPFCLLVQFPGFRFGCIANGFCLLFQLVGFCIRLSFDSVTLILKRISLGVARLRRGPIYTICGSASALSRAIPLIGYA